MAKNKKLVIRWRDGSGKHRQKTFKTLLDKKRFALELAEAKNSPPTTYQPDMLFSELAAEWRDRHAKVHQGDVSYRENVKRISLHLVPAFGRMKLCQLDLVGLSKFQQKLLETNSPTTGKPLSRKSINDIIKLAKQIMTTGVKWGYIPEAANHWRNLKNLKLPPQDFSFWEPRERDIFLAQLWPIDPGLARAAAVSVHTGVRVGELSGLQRRHVSFERETVRIEQTYSHKFRRLRRSTKTGEARTIPLNRVALDALASFRLVAPDQFLFNEPRMKHAATHLRKYAEAFGVQSIRWHDLRHTFASCLVMGGVDLNAVMTLMGHKNITQTLRYSHLTPRHLADSVRVLCASEGGRMAKVSNISGLQA